MEKGFGRGSWYTDILSLVEELPDEVWVSHTKHVGENWVVGQLKKIRAVILTFLKKMCLSYLNIYSPGYSLTWSEYENPDLCCNTRRACKIRLFHYLWKNFEVRSQKKSSSPPPPPPPPHLTPLSFSSGRIPGILRPLTTSGKHEKSQKSRTTIRLFLIFSRPHRLNVRFSFR